MSGKKKEREGKKGRSYDTNQTIGCNLKGREEREGVRNSEMRNTSREKREEEGI